MFINNEQGIIVYRPDVRRAAATAAPGCPSLSDLA
jgi:hypothetical protein